MFHLCLKALINSKEVTAHVQPEPNLGSDVTTCGDL